MLNDTSIAAVTTADLNRHIFFQDVNGSLRHTSYDAGANTWDDGVNYVSASSLPQNPTPLAAMEIYSQNAGANTDYATAQSYIHLFFVNTDDVLTATVIPTSSTTQQLPVPMNNSFPVAPASRSLKVSPFQVANQGFIANAMLTYESPNGTIDTLRGHFQGSSTAPQWQWTDVSTSIASAMTEFGTSLTNPFTTNVYEGTDSKGRPFQDISLSFLNPSALTTNVLDPIHQFSFGNWTGARKSNQAILLPLPRN